MSVASLPISRIHPSCIPLFTSQDLIQIHSLPHCGSTGLVLFPLLLLPTRPLWMIASTSTPIHLLKLCVTHRILWLDHIWQLCPEHRNVDEILKRYTGRRNVVIGKIDVVASGKVEMVRLTCFLLKLTIFESGHRLVRVGERIGGRKHHGGQVGEVGASHTCGKGYLPWRGSWQLSVTY